jgi:hypothetical protein
MIDSIVQLSGWSIVFDYAVLPGMIVMKAVEIACSL